jgi:hypothetical protein
MSSSESAYAWRMARTYGPEVCRLDRAGRMAWAQEAIDRLKREDDAEHEAHKRDCELCLRNAFCSYGFTLSPRYDQTMRLRGMIEMQKRDQEYTNQARAHGVVYEHHIDGFCAYWQNVRRRHHLGEADQQAHARRLSTSSNNLMCNINEDIRIYVAPGKPPKFPKHVKVANRLTDAEHLDLTQQKCFHVSGGREACRSSTTSARTP